MPFKLFQTTTFRLSVIFLLVYSLTTVVALGYIYWNTNVLLIRQLNQTVNAEIQGLAEQYRQGGVTLLASVVAERAVAPGNSLYLVTDQQGKHISGNLKNISQELWNTIGDVRFSYNRKIDDEKVETRHAFAKVFRLPQGFRLIVGRDVEDRRVFEQLMTSVWLGLAMITVIGLVGGWLVSRNLLSRIDQVTAASQAIMQGNLSERIPVNGSGDELDRLSHNLNEMLGKIEHLMNGVRDVSDNIAHDLKTPLNRLRNRIEAALHHHNGQNTYRETLEKTIEEADNLIKTFNALLSISQMEAGASSENRMRLHLSAIVHDIAELYEPVMDEDNIRLQTDIADDIYIYGDRQLLGQAVTNLLDNAMKYGVSDRKAQHTKNVITLGLRTIVLDNHKTYADIHISDSGPGIALKDREHVLKRFVRLEQSRSQPGSGLGLSLVAAVVQIHGGTLHLEDNRPGLKATIRIPTQRTVSDAKNTS